MYSLYNGRRWAADQRKFTHALTTVDGGFLGGSGEDDLQIVGDFPAAEIGVKPCPKQGSEDNAKGCSLMIYD